MNKSRQPCRIGVAFGLLAITPIPHINSVFAATAPSFQITVKPSLKSSDQVQSLEVSEQLDGSSMTAAPPSWRIGLAAPGVRHLAGGILDLKATDARGEVPLVVTDDPPSEKAQRHWKAGRQPVYPVVITYHVTPRPAAQGGPPFAMKAAGGGVAGSGRSFLVLPEDPAVVTALLKWDLSELAPGSVAATSLGRSPSSIPTARISDEWMIAGPAIVLKAPAPSGFEGYALGNPPFDSTAMLGWANRAYDILSSTFPYQGKPHYGFFIRATPLPSSGTGTATEGGSLVNTGNVYRAKEDISFFHDVVFHEMTHQWIGEIAGEAPWFSEGMTVYFTEMLRMQNGMATAAESADGLNRVIRNYYANKARNWSEARIEATPFDQEDVRLIPYGRGVLYFAELNAELRAKSHGTRGLVDAVDPLFRARLNGKPLDIEGWEVMLRRELGSRAVTEFRQTIIEGTRTALPPSDAFGPLLRRAKINWIPDGQSTSVKTYEWQAVATKSATR